MKEYKVITALFLSAVMLGTAPLTVWGAESFSTGESFSDGTENIPDIVTDSALSGESSERDYELSIETGTDVELTESDFYDPEFRVEKYVKVRNSGKKETRVRVDASGLKNFEVDDQMAKWSEDYEEQDSKRLLKPGETLDFFVLPKQEYGTYDETFDFLADDGSRYPVHITMNREKNPTEKKSLEITEKSSESFPIMHWGYKTLPEARPLTTIRLADYANRKEFLAALAGVDMELYEAARIDGAGRWRLMWHITLPAIRGTIVIMLILKVGSILNTGYEQIFLMQNDLNYTASEVFDTYIYNKGIKLAQYSMATAAGVFKSVVSLIMVLAANKIAKMCGESGFY